MYHDADRAFERSVPYYRQSVNRFNKIFRTKFKFRLANEAFNFGNEYERKSMIRHSKWDALTIFYIPSKLIFQFHLHAQNPDGQVSYYVQTNEKAPLWVLFAEIFKKSVYYSRI